MKKARRGTLPLEGGGQGGGESVVRCVSGERAQAPPENVEAHLTPPLTPPPLGAGRPLRRDLVFSAEAAG